MTGGSFAAARTRPRAGVGVETSSPELPPGVHTLAALGVAVIVAAIVGSTPVGSGDYGQWLMVARAFSGAATPDYRALSDVPPLIPVAIGWLQAWLGDPVAALRAIGMVIVVALAAAFHAAGTALSGRSVTGLIAVILALLVTDRYLELLAFGGLLQAGATALLVLAVAGFTQAIRDPANERRWWFVGCLALFATCLTHVPTATIAMPVGVGAALIRVIHGDDRPEGEGPLGGRLARLRAIAPLLGGLGVIGVYWLFTVAPESAGYVSNPASLAYRGPERVPGLLAAYPPTLAIVVVGLAWFARWAWPLAIGRRLPAPGDGRSIVATWLVATWAAYGLSALSGASTDYPRFVPLLVAPLVVAAADGLTAFGLRLGRLLVRQPTTERGLIAIGLAIVLIAPFSIANYRSEAHGYELTDQAALAAAAAWTDSRLKPGLAVLAPVREGKWFEGLTGRSALFSSQIRYAFRPIEWERSLAAAALFRGNVGLANESFVLTMNDAAPSATGAQPRAVLVEANHGGEYVDLLRLVPASSLILDEAGNSIASLPALQPAGFEQADGANRVAITTRWSGTRGGEAVAYVQTLALWRGSNSFELEIRADTALPVSGLEIEFRPPLGIGIVDVVEDGASGEVVFARIGRTEPALRITVADGTITWAPDGGLRITSPGRTLSLRVMDLTAGAASSPLRLLDPAALVDAYDIGAAILRRDPTYDARRARLEGLGFHVARAEGPYIVMVRAGAALPPPAAATDATTPDATAPPNATTPDATAPP